MTLSHFLIKHAVMYLRISIQFACRREYIFYASLILMNIPTNFNLISFLRKKGTQRTYPQAVCGYTTCPCASVPVTNFQKRVAMGIMFGQPISEHLVDVIRYEVGVTIAPPISWGFKAADCNHHWKYANFIRINSGPNTKYNCKCDERTIEEYRLYCT
jgi:hypothetical protein